MDDLDEIKQRKLQDMMREGMGDTPEEGWPDTPVNMSDDTMMQTIQKYPLAIVDCWAEWCSPCRMVAPVIEAMAKDYRGKIVFAKLNVDKNPATARQFGIMSIPTLLVFKNGKLVDQLIGAMPRQMLDSKIQKYL